MYLRNSSVVTTVDGAKGNGGNIDIGARFVVLDGSSIRADAVGGNGGNIDIVAEEFIPSIESVVQASSATGISGDITIRAPADTVTAALADLARRFRVLPVLDRIDCTSVAARTGISSLTQEGRAAVADDGDGLRTRRYFTGPVVQGAFGTQANAGLATPSVFPSVSDATSDRQAIPAACR